MENVNEEDRQVLNEILIFDLYLRENMKTRPKFAGEVKDYMEILKALNIDKNRGKMVHAEKFSYDIEKTVKQKQPVKYENYVIFDYERRNPLNYEAYYTVAPLH